MDRFSPFKFRTKEELQEALQKQLQAALEYDAKAAKAHHKAEAAYLKFFRGRCREALKLSYSEAKARGFRVVASNYEGTKGYSTPELSKPQCPSSRADTVRNAIQHVERWTLSSWPAKGPLVVRCTGQHQFLHHVLSLGVGDQRTEVCPA